MSQSTPAKQDRIERHLMRQRGAGVRAVTVDFGFSFEGLAPRPGFTAAGVIPERRDVKVGVEATVPVSKKDVELVAEVPAGVTEVARREEPLPGEQKVGRKRKADFEDEGMRSVEKEGDVEDSFDATIRSRKRPVKRARKVAEPMAQIRKKDAKRAKKAEGAQRQEGEVVEATQAEGQEVDKTATRSAHDGLEKAVKSAECAPEEVEMLDAELEPAKPPLKKPAKGRKKAVKLVGPMQEEVEMPDAEPEPAKPATNKSSGRGKKAARSLKSAQDDDVIHNVETENMKPATNKMGGRRNKAEVQEEHGIAPTGAEGTESAPPEPVKKRGGRKRKQEVTEDADQGAAEEPIEEEIKPKRKPATRRRKAQTAVDHDAVAGAEEVVTETAPAKGRKKATNDGSNDHLPTEEPKKARQVKSFKATAGRKATQQAKPQPGLNATGDDPVTSTKRTRTSRRKAAPKMRAMNLNTVGPIEDDVDELSAESVLKDSEVQNGTERQLGDSETIREHNEPPVAHVGEHPAPQPGEVTATEPPKKSRAKKTAPKPRSKVTTHLAGNEECHATPGADAVDGIGQADRENPATTTAKLVLEKGPRAAKKARNTHPGDAAHNPKEQDEAATTPLRKYQPLAESNVNRSMMSVSPEKRLSHDDVRPLKPKRQALKNETKTTLKSSGCKATFTHPPTPPASQEHETSNNKGVEEDIDWLFAPQERKAPPTQQAASRAPRPKANARKMADLDLDDLLSNIATFADERNAENPRAPPATKAKVSKRTVKGR